MIGSGIGTRHSDSTIIISVHMSWVSQFTWLEQYFHVMPILEFVEMRLENPRTVEGNACAKPEHS